MAIPVKLPVFEGPLDLLMHLIEKNKIDIYDIPIAGITDQYLQYVHQMDHEDMDVTSEFLVMAATLLDIKSRMLLPREKDEETGEEEADPREELVRRLLEYKMYKYLSGELAAYRDQAGVRYFREQDLPKEVRSYQPPIDYSELLKDTDLKRLETVFGEVLRRKKSRRDPIRSGFGKIKREEVNIDTKTLYIRAYLQAHPHTDFRALLESQESKEEVIVTFLILLELMKVQQVQIVQDSICGKILIEAAKQDSVKQNPAGPKVPAQNEEVQDVAEQDIAESKGPVKDAEIQDVAEQNIAEPEEPVPDVEVQDVTEQDIAEPEESVTDAEIQDVAEQDIAEPEEPVTDAEVQILAEPDIAEPESPAQETVSALSFQRTREVVFPLPIHVFSPAERPVPDTAESVASTPAAAACEDQEVSAETHIEEPELDEEDVFADAVSGPEPFYVHLWKGQLPRYSSSWQSVRSGHSRLSMAGERGASRIIRRSDPFWESSRLSRLWARRR